MKLSMSRVSIALLVLIAVGSGCNTYENQNFAFNTREFAVANPAFPVSLNEIQRNNANHRVVVAVLDTGIDYLHPALIPNLHFNLNEFDAPVAPFTRFTDRDRDGFAGNVLGYDFLGKDGLPSFRVVERKTAQRDLGFEEQAGLSHGTHVAGIMTGRDYRIGVIPFRILPIDENDLPRVAGEAVVDSRTLADALGRTLRDSIYLAKRQGVRVANMSIGVDSNPPEYREADLRRAFADFTNYVNNAAPEMILTIASGNDSKDVSSGYKTYPCQVRAGNAVCVGSVNSKGEISEFSNIGNQFVDIYAPGEDIISTVPGDYEGAPAGAVEAMSGTSMAAPYIGHVLAKMLIEKPCLKARQAIDLMVQSADPRQTVVRAGGIGSLPAGATYRYRVVNLNSAIRAARGAYCFQ